MNLERLQAQLIVEEGSPLHTYPDSKGILTGGIGHNLIAHPEHGFDRVGILVPDEVRDRWFKNDIQGAINDLNRFAPWWQRLDDVRQNALLNTCFNMGWGNGKEGLSTFKNTLTALAIKDFARAASGFEHSQWAKDVGPTRQGRICKMIATGEWPHDIPVTGST